MHVRVRKPNAVTFSVPPNASGLSPDATVPESGPTSRASPVATAGFLVPLQTVVPPPASTGVSVGTSASRPIARGAVTAEVVRATVAGVPLWAAVRVASPPPRLPRSAVAVPGATAAAEGGEGEPAGRHDGGRGRAGTDPCASHGVRFPLRGGGEAPGG